MDKPSMTKKLTHESYLNHAENTWQQELQMSIRNLDGLIGTLESVHPNVMNTTWADRIRKAKAAEADLQNQFRFSVTRSYLSAAQPHNERCPILGQILPSVAETNDTVFASVDPLAEENHMPVPGLTHRYPDRVLWYLSHHCAVYCRFCMRKRKVSQSDTAPGRSDIEKAFQYIENHTELHEVILSGGDPLSLGDDMLDMILQRLRAMDHIVSVRIHSRMPVTLPSRFTDSLVQILSRYSPLTLVTHFNHSVEIGEASKAALTKLRQAGIMLLNQSVLLRNINDSIDDLKGLFLTLIKSGVKPYYLHQCDEVKGVSHFRVPISRGIALMKSLRGRIPGIALPLYVVDLPGGGGKVPVDSSYQVVAEIHDDVERYSFLNYAGLQFDLSEFQSADGVVRQEVQSGV